MMDKAEFVNGEIVYETLDGGNEPARVIEYCQSCDRYLLELTRHSSPGRKAFMTLMPKSISRYG